MIAADPELLDHLARTTPLSREQLARVVAEVVGSFDEPVEAFVQRRHRELKRAGLANEAIFARVGAELRARRGRPPELSARQLRRMVYG